MSEVLTPDEIAALADAFGDAPPAAEPAAPSGVRPVDLTNLERVLDARAAGLAFVLERFARGLRDAVATFFGDVPAVHVASTEIVRWARVAGRLAPPVGLVAFRLTPLRGKGLLVVPGAVVAALVQVACGGTSARVAALPARDFSPIERRLLERLAARVLAELRAAWAPIAPLGCDPAGIESAPALVAVAAAEDLVVAAELAVAIPGGLRGAIGLVVPRASLEPVRAQLESPRPPEGDASSDGGWAARLRERLADVPVPVRAELGSARLSMARLVGLAPGDLLPLDTGAEGPVIVRVGGRPRFRGTPGQRGGANAVRITDRL